MTSEALAFWAGVAAIFLLVNAAVIAVVMGISLGFGWWYLRRGRKALRTPLLMAQVYALRIQYRTMQAGDAIANVPIQIHATTARVKTTAQTLMQGKSDK